MYVTFMRNICNDIQCDMKIDEMINYKGKTQRLFRSVS